MVSARLLDWTGGSRLAGWRLTVRARRAHPRLADIVLIVLIGVVASAWLVNDRAAGPTVWVLEAGLLVPLLLRRRCPVLVLAALVAVAAVQWWVNVELVADVGLLIALYTVAAQSRPAVTAAAVVVAEVGALLAALRWSLAGTEPRSFVFLSGLVAASVALGANQRTRRAHVATLVERAERLEYERDQQAQIAAATERTRIAREMHDVIAHSLAVIVALADGAGAKLPGDPARAAAAIHDVSDVGRQALGDTRRLLGVLRTEGSDAGFAPQPGIGQIPDLVSQVRTTGLAGELTVDGPPFPLPPGAELTVYRIVQEAITNTLKHARGATTVWTRISYRAPQLDILVRDDGQTPGAPMGGGHGLAGMRERVAAYGGAVTAGPAPEGGWSVRAHLSVNGSAS